MTVSAWDIAGAVVWTLWAYAGWNCYFLRRSERSQGWANWQILGSLSVTASAIYCIARLCGAHA